MTPDSSSPALSGHYDVIAARHAPGIDVQIRNYSIPPAEQLHVCYPRFVLGSQLTPFPKPSQGRYAPTKSGHFTNIGSLVFAPAGLPWTIRTAGGKFRTMSCEYDPEIFKSITGRNDDWSDRELSVSHNIQNPWIAQVMQRLAGETVSPGFASEILVEVLATSLIVELARHFQNVPAGQLELGSGLEPWQRKRIEDYISEISDAPPTLGAMAALCCIGTRTFMRRFKASTGQTVSGYLRQQQISKAQMLLAQTKLPLKEVAYRLGFSSQSNFTFAFRREIGDTPKQFRRRHS
jgi:AraC family transcriptional regulator